MKAWFRTKNDQIIDLNTFTAFWIEKVETGYRIFGEKENSVDWEIANFEPTQENEANKYIDHLWQIILEVT
jgi:hypothetical protein